MKIKILHASVNPNYWDTKELARIGYDEAVRFFERVDRDNCSVQLHEIDVTSPSECLFAPDGVLNGDDSDTNLVWLKVE